LELFFFQSEDEVVAGPSREQSDIWKPTITPEEADKLLKERFLSLFFWPGHMSLNK
jgi:hypothetical protein